MAGDEDKIKHSEIKQVFPNIFMVTGENHIQHNGVNQQHSRNMIIIRQKNKLSLINTVRLSAEGLAKIDSLGEVDCIYRIGAFHGRDDAFYHQRYNEANFYTLKGLQDEHGGKPTHYLTPGDSIPIHNSQLIFFESSIHPEAVIYIAENNGVLITCDSVKNWLKPDEYFNQDTINLFHQQNFFKKAMIDNVWTQATQIKPNDLIKLQHLPIKHLLSAHGEPLLHDADTHLNASIAKVLAGKLHCKL